MTPLKSGTDLSPSNGLEEDARTDLLILQPTPFCNIDCQYCYLPSRNDKSRMSDEVLAATFEKCAHSGLAGDQLSIIWHAGEPLVLPVKYYESAFELAERAFAGSTKITHCFQTNGMLIDEKWCALFDRPDVTVGVSIDGPKRLHDRFRVTRSGAGSWERAIKGLRMLVERGVDFHVISVLTRNSLFFPDEIFRFYLANGVEHVCFNVEEQEGVHEETSLARGQCEVLYRRFMERFLDLVTENKEIKSVREFGLAFGAILASANENRINPQIRPLAIVTVAANGDFTTFSPELLGMEDAHFGDFVLGNVLNNDLCDIMGDKKFKDMHGQIQAGVRKCRDECTYFPVCGGGAPANKLYENGSFETTETIFCRYTVQIIADIALQACEKEIDIERLADAGGLAHPIQ